MSEQVFARRRRSQRWRRWRPYVVAAAAVVLAGVVVWLVWFSSVLGVKTVQVEGLSTVSRASVLQRADLVTGRPLARLDTAAVESRISSLPRVQSVDVTRHFPHTVRITVVERVAVATTDNTGSLRGIDRYGVDFRGYSEKPKGLVPLDVPSSGEARTDSLVACAEVVHELQTRAPALLKQVQGVKATTKDSVSLDLTKGRTAVWGSAVDAPAKIRVLTVLLAKVKATRYDVSAPTQPTTQK